MQGAPARVEGIIIFQEHLDFSEADARAAGHVHYYSDLDEAMKAGRAKDAQLLLLTNPIPVDRLAGLAAAKKVLPDYNLTFFPPLLSGLVMNELSTL